jgi:hypothetical protein
MLEPAGPPPIIPTSKSGADEFISAAFSQECLTQECLLETPSFAIESGFQLWTFSGLDIVAIAAQLEDKTTLRVR